MNDTPDYVIQKQFEIINSRPLSDRIANLFEMTELSRTIIKNRIKERSPDISEIDLKIELFKLFYRFDFDSQTLEKIAEDMKQSLMNDKKDVYNIELI